jgi:hypothetical protein
MHPLNQQLFNILKHTRIEIEHGEPLDIRLLLNKLMQLHILSAREVENILESI